MAGTTIIWTCLPAGVRREAPDGPWRARLSLAVSPRLAAATDKLALRDFPAFMDWPRTLREMSPTGLEFEVRLRDGQRVVASSIVAGTVDAANAPDSLLWRRLFDGDTPVAGPPPDDDTEAPGRRGAPAVSDVLTFDSGDLLNTIDATYDHALRYDLGLALEPPALSSFALPDVGMRTADLVNGTAVEAFAAFYGIDGDAAANEKKNAPLAAPEVPDFHQMVSALASHPQVLRRLGLLLDFELSLDELPLDADARAPAVTLAPRSTVLTQVQHHPMWTAVDYQIGASTRYRRFSVADQPAGGRPALFSASDQSRVSLVHVEHATLALMQKAKLASGPSHPMPALLQGGMRLSHEAMPTVVARGMLSQAVLEDELREKQQRRLRGENVTADLDEPLYAEQLLLGLRADVRRVDGGVWRSLCRRSVRYRSGSWAWPPVDAPALDDEGHIEPTVYAHQLTQSSQARITTEVFEWDGWSLVAPRPDASDGEATILPTEVLPAGADPLQASIEVPPGSLEPQRFGERYRFRLRTVFLGGVGISAEEADELGDEARATDHVTQATACLRVESAKAPITVRGQERGFGEAGDVAVLRDADDPRYATPEYKLHVLPPEVPLRIAEKHGVFDSLSGAASWELIASHRRSLKRDAAKPDSDESTEPLASEAVLTDELYTPYLPDPMVRQAVLTLPDNAGTVDLPRFDDLPGRARGKELARSCRLIFRRGENGVTARLRGRDMLIDVSPGRVHRFTIAARLSPDDLAVSALARRQARDPEIAPHLVAPAARGQLPTLAPSATITVLYATQRPLVPPAFGRPLIMPRKADDTTAALADDALHFDRDSTGRLDVYAGWEDPVDDPANPGWTSRKSVMHAGGVEIDLLDGKPLDPIELEAMARSPLSHDFGDTRHHEVSYTVHATSRFADFYPDEITDDADNTSLVSQQVRLHVPSTAPPAVPSVAFVLPTFSREDSGPVPGNPEHRRKHRGAGLRVYLNRGWFSSGAGEQLALVLANPRTPQALRETVSEWGLNPLRNSAPLPGPLEDTHVWGGDRRIEHWPITGGSLALVLYDVMWSDEHHLPFVDIELLSQRAFMPLIRLALARFQAHAIEGCELSGIARSDFVPLSPGRAVTVSRLTAGVWKLDVRGYSYRNEDDRLTDAGSAITSVLVAHIEIMPRGAPEDAAAWRPTAAPVYLSADAVEPWHYHWTGRLELGDAQLLKRRWRRRIVLREYEVFDVDKGSDADLEERSRLIAAQTVAI